ncbi:hypothetical protein SSP35_18_00900 [Streptomyces sp. NBRC 110611]|uniref:hypothetical protein n=1 Tax=Streptomyces sp. NBRC 110611 TaxID=1621259 RepID=UPI00085545F2|nr:hypothetical protein [Streptomyces sp. NBRC 110611]GAU70362.1 hypothetical protein SSP35_18_00900 [Streptomyces sp. NBRC 110611]
MAATVVAVPVRRGGPRGVRRRVAHAAGLVVVGGLLLGAGQEPAVLVCAVSVLGAGALLLAELTTVRRGLLRVAWAGAAAGLVWLNVAQQQAGLWLTDRKPWVTVTVLAVLGALAAAAVATARMAQDPDIGPGGV